ncbi:MAG: hypothetical protein SNJ78_03595 [Spirochaetales bacterium]
MNSISAFRIKKAVQNQTVYYTLHWSPIKRVNKYDIQKTVPAMAGMFELFYRGKDHKLYLFHYGRAWLGGLRAVIREMTDATLMKDRPDIQRILNNYECFYRFVICESREDLEDLMGFFQKEQGAPQIAASKRYKDVRLKEIDS